MSVFVVRYQMTFNYESVCRHGARFRVKLTLKPVVRIPPAGNSHQNWHCTHWAPALEQDPSFNHNYDNFDLKIRNIEEKTL
ncbi:MAG: hypothetical protein Ct9H300mP16_06610 [Pseudomonadota bacterium]|nr:MAG: hypothetical protein Ct9H300mP16_06610 [Pseudomonadota bacterium]